MTNYLDQCKLQFLNIDGGDIPDKEYFKLQGISNSKLKYINPVEGGSPELYLQGIPYSYNVSTEIGSAVHQQLLQPQDFILSDYKNKPSGKCGYFVDLVYEFRKQGLPFYQAIKKASEKADYYNNKLTPKILRKAIKLGLEYYVYKYRGEFNVNEKEVVVLPQKSLNIAKACIKSINNNYEIQRIVKQGVFGEKEFLNEIALFSDIKITFPNGDIQILPFKGKLDSVVIDNENKKIYLNDVKTTSRPVDIFMDRIIDEEVYNGVISMHHYYRQIACYLIMLQMYVKQILHKEDYSYECNFFVVETNNKFQSRRFKVSQGYIDAGLNEFKELMCRIAYHTKYGFKEKFPTTDS